tara:strand:- start:463 stop:1584 length:1122 start_codon:yes stop_codon:yes gene_type:complete
MKENKKEEVIVISAYCPTLKQQDKLRGLVRKVKSMNHDIILVSHSIIPSDIIESCDYYLYDKENKLLHGDDYKFWYNFDFKFNGGTKIHIESKDSFQHSNQYNVLLPVISLVLSGLNLAKYLGYTYAHYIEYDCDVTANNFFKNNTKILKKGYDNLSYRWKIDTGTYKGNYELVMCYIAFNLKTYTFNDLKYNESNIINSFKPYSPIFESWFIPTYLDNNGKMEKRNCYIKELLYPVTNIASYGFFENEKLDIPYKDGLIRDTIKGYDPKPQLDLLTFPDIEEDKNAFYILIISDIVNDLEKDHNYEIIVNDTVLRGKFQEYEITLKPMGIPWDELYYLKLSINGYTFCEYDLNLPGEKDRLLLNNQISPIYG